jgi:5-methylcytosine-specific restriction protein A
VAKLATSLADVIANIETLERYSLGTEQERRFHAKRLKNGKLFVALRSNGHFAFAPSKFAGYKNNDIGHVDDLPNRDGRVTNVRITELTGTPYDQGRAGYEDIDRSFLEYCRKFGIEPSKHHRLRRYWLLVSDNMDIETFRIAEELNDSEVYEGAKQEIVVNRYERNPEARRACIAHYGCKCGVCDFDFEQIFGEMGKGYIHVHHIVPLSNVGQRYRVNPIKDLRPVCPNCHAMLHQKPEMSIEQLKAHIKRSTVGR